MKIHFAEFENWGSYEIPLWGCEETLCGCTSETAVENATDIWMNVSCKKCLRLRNGFMNEILEREEIIVEDMGRMAEFLSSQKEQP